MTPEIISNLIVGALSLVAGGGVWQYWIARRRAPIDQQGADIAAADTTVGMTLAFAQKLTEDYTRLSEEFKTEREERKALAERFRILEAALYEEKQVNTKLSGIIREFNSSWDDLEGRWDTHRLLGHPPSRPPQTSRSLGATW